MDKEKTYVRTHENGGEIHVDGKVIGYYFMIQGSGEQNITSMIADMVARNIKINDCFEEPIITKEESLLKRINEELKLMIINEDAMSDKQLNYHQQKNKYRFMNKK